MKTVHEAKELRCPYAGLVALIVKNAADVESNYCCNNEWCMMWRWKRNFLFLKSNKGYCGLAGKPDFVRGF